MLDLIRDGVAYSLDDGTYAAYIDDDGWDQIPLHRLVERGPQQHGETDLGFRLDPRVGTVILQLPRASNRSAAKTSRQALLSLLTPADTPLALRWTWDDGVVRQIDVYVISVIGEHAPSFNRRVAISLRAPDPTFYDPAGRAVVFSLGGGGGSFTIPHPIPHGIGASTIDAMTVVDNAGDWRAVPHLIRITGPLADPVIANQTTGEVLDFSGIAISAGSWYDIDLRYGRKTVVDETGASKIHEVSGNLETWHLQQGANSLRATGTAATGVSKIEIAFYERYLGI